MKRWLGWPAVVAAIAAAFVAAAFHLHLQSSLQRLTEKRDFVRREIAGLELEIGEMKQLRPMIAEFLARKAVIESLQRDRGAGVLLLNELARLRPDGIRLVSITFSQGRGRVEGVAASEQALRKFTSALTASSVLQAPEGLVSRGRDFSFQVALRAAASQ
jgi:Tfp pilus assembly protein PilN